MDFSQGVAGTTEASVSKTKSFLRTNSDRSLGVVPNEIGVRDPSERKNVIFTVSFYKNSINKSPHNSGLVDNDKLK